MRVAVSQFATSLNVQENLATCLRIINETATCVPNLIVLPEYCNTQFFSEQYCHTQFEKDKQGSGYDTYQESCQEKYPEKYPGKRQESYQAWQQALSINGDFLRQIAEQAKKHHCYIVINVTLRRGSIQRPLTNNKNEESNGVISVTSCLFSPLGELIHQVDKQQLTAKEKEFFSHTTDKHVTDLLAKPLTMPLGMLGLLAGNEDVTYSTSRELALHGTQLLCHSNSSSTLDQSRYYGPARASENKLFLVSANKIGSLIPQTLRPETKGNNLCGGDYDDHFESSESLVGIGHSQIISPTGDVIAKLPNDKEGFVFADIDLSQADSKLRPDNTDVFKQRRPALYNTLTTVVKNERHEGTNTTVSTNISTDTDAKVPVTANVAIFATYKSNEQAIEDVCHYIENNLTDIIQLPELFFISDKLITHNADELTKISDLCDQLITQIKAELRPFQYVCTSLVLEGIHQAVIISDQGLFATQQQLHFCQRYQWTELGDEVNIIALPLEQGSINVAMLTADDANIPEMVNIVVLNNIHLLLVPFDIQEACEVEYSLLSRAAEHNICIVAASREKNFVKEALVDSSNIYSKNKVKSQKSTGFIANLSTDSVLLNQWKSRKKEGYANKPLVKHQQGKITKAVIHPIAACKN